MLFVNSLLFILFCLAGLYFLFNEGRMIAHPFIKKEIFFATGPQILLIFTMATGMFMLGRDYNSPRLLIWIIYLFIGLFIVKGEIKFTLASGLYMLYILYLFFSFSFLSPDKWFGVRVIAKYIFPLFVLLFANKVTNTEYIVFSGIKYAFIIAIFTEISYFFWFPWAIEGTLWAPATFVDHLVAMCAIALALFYITSKKKYLWLLIFFFAYPLIVTIRTGIVGITACLSVFFLFKYKWKAVPVIAFVVIAAVLVILYVPNVRDKMFRKQMTAEEVMENSDNLTFDDIDTSGRQAMWEWSLKNYYQNNKIFGTGVGNLQKVFYTEKHPFGTMKIVHNDFVQILCDNGLVGLILYLSISLSLVIHSFFIYNNKRNNEMIRLCAIVAGSSLVGILCTSYTDNAVNYSLATYCYPYAFYGMALGLRQKYE